MAGGAEVCLNTVLVKKGALDVCLEDAQQYVVVVALAFRANTASSGLLRFGHRDRFRFNSGRGSLRTLQLWLLFVCLDLFATN